MLGFVSALSSAVAVMILIMTTLLINLGLIMIKKEEEAKTVRIDKLDIIEEMVEKDDINKRGLSLSLHELKKIKNSNNKSFVVYCDYGKNLSEDVARKISTLNYIRIKMVVKDADVELKPPVFKDSSTNTCYVEKK